MHVRFSRRGHNARSVTLSESSRLAIVSLVISLIAAAVSVFALVMQYQQFTSDRELVLTGRPCTDDKFIPKQECISLAPTSSGPTIERLWMTWPSPMGEEPVQVTTPTHIDINGRVEDLRIAVESSEADAAKRGPRDWGYIWDGYVPVVVRIEYVAFNRHHEAMGLYALDFDHFLNEESPWLRGFRFVRPLNKGETPRELTDTLWRAKTFSSRLTPR